ncbi:Putative amino acid permease [Mycobacteroides abscessus subsp. massiliense]|nr:Putative amino acid permease [Mycobacteroides abscessus subsp. massiliense]
MTTSTNTAPPVSGRDLNPTLRRVDVFAVLVCALVGVDTLGAVSAYGGGRGHLLPAVRVAHRGIGVGFPSRGRPLCVDQACVRQVRRRYQSVLLLDLQSGVDRWHALHRRGGHL